MAARWMSLKSGNGKPRTLAYSAWLNVLSALMARTAAPRAWSFFATSPRSVSSGVQIEPQS